MSNTRAHCVVTSTLCTGLLTSLLTVCVPFISVPVKCVWTRRHVAYYHPECSVLLLSCKEIKRHVNHSRCWPGLETDFCNAHMALVYRLIVERWSCHCLVKTYKYEQYGKISMPLLRPSILTSHHRGKKKADLHPCEWNCFYLSIIMWKFTLTVTR